MSSTISKYFIFRLRQSIRMLQDVGLANLILISPVLVLSVLGILQAIWLAQNVLLAGLLLFFMAGFHFTRKDRFFLEQLHGPLFCFFLIDYFLLLSPFLVGFVFWGKWYNLLTVCIGTLVLSFIKPRYLNASGSKILNLFQFNWIPLALFEWRCGLRKNVLGLGLLWILGLVFSYYPIVVPVVVVFMALGVTNFFQFYENKDILLAVNHQRKLLGIKVFGSLKLFNLLFLPHYIAHLVFHYHGYQYIGALVVLTIIAQMIITFSICVKYKNYRFHHFKVYSGLPMGIFVACLLVPFLWPIPVLMLISFWRKAQENLLQHYA